MRIVAGLHRGRCLAAPAGIRPTADRVRETLFNVLAHNPLGGALALPEARVLDAFAGSGALGLEALSRGAARATFMESDAAALDAIRANVAALKEEARAEVLRADATRPPRGRAPATLLLMDPPYGKDLAAPALAALADAGWLAPDALAVVELGARDDFAPPSELGASRFEVVDERRIGDGRLVFLRFRATPPPG